MAILIALGAGLIVVLLVWLIVVPKQRKKITQILDDIEGNIASNKKGNK